MRDDKNNEKSLHDLQKMWYELEMGLAYIRQNKLNRGLRMLHYVFTHFNEIDEEQLDFFSFCLRRYSLKGFVDMVRFNMEDVGRNTIFIKGHSHYLKYSMTWQISEKMETYITSYNKLLSISIKIRKYKN